MLEKIGEDAYKIEGDCNVYLITKPIPLVIDTGQPSERENIRKEIEKIISLNKIKFVLLTHLHYDHSGNVNLFKKAKFYCAKEEIEDMKSNPNQFFFGNIPKEIKPVLMNKLEIIPDEIAGLKLIKVPGHTRGSLSLLDEKRGLLFSGDTLFRNGIGRTDFPNSLPEEMPKSLKKLLNLLKEKKLKLMPGHDY